MKRFILLLILLGIAAAQAELSVVTTLTDYAAIASEIGADKVAVRSLARGSEDPHFVDPKPSFIRDLNRADLLVESGIGLESGWLPPLIKGARNPKLAVGQPGRVFASRGVRLREVSGGPVSRALGDVHPEGDPHFHLDPVAAKAIASNIADALETLDPANAGFYADNLARFQGRIDDGLGRWQKQLAPLRGRKFISYHKSFGYLAERFGLEPAGTLEPKPGIAPSPAHVKALVESARTDGVRLVIQEPNKPEKLGRKVAAEIGGTLVILPGDVGALPGTDSYFAFIDRIVELLANAKP